MVHHIGQQSSILGQYMAEIRAVGIQEDRLRFRHNLSRIAEILSYELSKTLPSVQHEVQTPLGLATVPALQEQPVLFTILRAGLAMHDGVLRTFDHADSAYTYGIGNVSEDVVQLLQRTKESLYLGLNQAAPGKRVGDIGFAVQSYTESFGYGVVRELVGHGVGKKLHESPEVPNYGRRGEGAKLKEGMVIAIEPMINLGKRQISVDKDGWTIRTIDRKESAHFEHTVAVKKGKADILSSFEFVEEVLNKK